MDDRSEQLPSPLAELLNICDVRLVTVRRHPGLQLLGAQPAVAVTTATRRCT